MQQLLVQQRGLNRSLAPAKERGKLRRLLADNLTPGSAEESPKRIVASDGSAVRGAGCRRARVGAIQGI